MININELRRLAQAATPGPDGVSMRWLKLLQDFQEKANPSVISEIIDRLEAAESVLNDFSMTAQEVECLLERYRRIEREAEALRARIEMAEQEHCDATSQITQQLSRLADENVRLRTRIEEMEQQEPVAWMPIKNSQDGRKAVRKFFRETLNRWDFDNYINQRLAADFACVLGGYFYALPGAQPAPSLASGDASLISAGKTQPAQKAVAYLDIGAGGYMDIGTDVTDEQLASLPKGRHMLSIVGTYGVDGYVSAQPAPSIPEGVKKVTRGFHWNGAAQHHTPTIEVEFEPVPAGSPNNAKGWQDRDRLAAFLTAATEEKP